MQSRLKWVARRLTIAQTEILLAVATGKHVSGDFCGKPLTNLIRKGFVSLTDTPSTQHSVTITKRGKEWLDRASDIKRAWEAYSSLVNIAGESPKTVKFTHNDIPF